MTPTMRRIFSPPGMETAIIAMIMVVFACNCINAQDSGPSALYAECWDYIYDSNGTNVVGLNNTDAMQVCSFSRLLSFYNFNSSSGEQSVVGWN
jgi:hypothetical protein